MKSITGRLHVNDSNEIWTVENDENEIDLETLPVDYIPKGVKLISHGFKYQYSLLAFYVCKWLNKEISKFRFASEIKSAGRFDDLVLQYNNQENEIKLRLMQMKHRIHSSKKLTRQELFQNEKSQYTTSSKRNKHNGKGQNKKSTYNLETYFSSFKELINNDSEDKMNGDIEDISLFTNIDLKFDTIMKSEMFDKTTEDGFNVYTFAKENRENNIKILTRNKKGNNAGSFISNGKLAKNADSFFDKLKIFVCSDEDIERKTKGEIQTYFQENDPEDIIYKTILNGLDNWVNEPKGTFMKKKDCIELMIKAKRNKENKLSVLHDFNLCELQPIIPLIVKNDSELFQKLFEENTLLFNIIAYVGVEITLMKLIKYCQSDKLKIITNKEFIAYPKKQLLKDLFLNECQYLIIACYEEEVDISAKVVYFIREYNSEIQCKKIITVTTSKKNNQDKSVESIEDHIKFEELDEIYKNEILRKSITFIGRSVKLSDFSKFIDIHEIINDKFLWNLVNTQGLIEIGNISLKQNKLDEFYCYQKLRYFNEINIKLLKQNFPNNIYLISGMNKKEFNNLKTQLLSGNDSTFDQKLFEITTEKEFIDKCKENNEGNITWIEYKSKKYFWKQTSGSIKNVKKMFIKNSYTHINLDNLIECNDVILISAAPGMGKSTFLSFLATEYTKKSCEIWAVKLDLIDYEEQFKNITLDSDEPKSFIMRTFQNEDDKILFEKYFDSKRVVVLIDGFDEVTPYYREHAIKLILKLKEMNIKIWITTRPQEQQYLEEMLNVLSYSLAPFNEKKQYDFFSKFWKNKFDMKDEDAHLKQNIKDIIDTVNKLVCCDEKTLFETPIHCRMFADICDPNQKNNYKTINVINLYEQFIEVKWDIFVKEKLKINEANCRFRDILEDGKEKFIYEHKLLSLCSLFDKEVLSELLTESERGIIKRLLKNLEKCKENKGIIKKISNEKPLFIHKTFAEYFLALWLHDRVENSESAKHFFITHLFEKENEGIRRFFDFISDSDDNIISKCILNNGTAQLQPKDKEWKDKFGRNILHISSGYLSKDSYQNLIKEGVDVTLEDKLFGWSPLRYACSVKAWCNVDTLLKKSTENIIDFIDNKEELYLLASEYGYIEIVKYLIKNVDINIKEKLIFAKNKEKQTALHLAIQNRHLSLCEYLLKVAKDIVNEYDRRKYHALHYAIKYFKQNLKFMKKLIASGANVDAKDEHGRTPLILVVQKGDVNACLYLVTKTKADVNLKDKRNKTALYYAKKKNNSNNNKMIQCLIEAEANILFAEQNNNNLTQVFNSKNEGRKKYKRKHRH